MKAFFDEDNKWVQPLHRREQVKKDDGIARGMRKRFWRV